MALCFERVAVSVVLACALAMLGRGARSEGRTTDPLRPQNLHVGPTAQRSPMNGIHRSRSGMSKFALPGSATLLWQRRAPGPPVGALVVDERGSIAGATTDGRVFQFDADGRPQWETRIASIVLAGPILLDGGDRVVVTPQGVVALSPLGTESWRHELLLPEDAQMPPPLPTSDGGLAFAFGKRVTRLGPKGTLRDSKTLDRPVSGLLGDDSVIFAVDSEGAVWKWNELGLVHRLGSFGRPTVSETVWIGDALIAATRQNMVAVDASDGSRRTFSEPGPIVRPLAGAEEAMSVLTTDGALLTLGNGGQVTTRSVLRSATARSVPWSARALLSDRRGRTAIAVSGRGVALIGALGEVHWVESSRCIDPIALAPQAAARLAVACDSGLLAVIGEQTKKGT